MKQSSAPVKSLALVPLGGLCNRLRAILSALSLARDCQVPLEIVWFRDEGLNARYGDLFLPFSVPEELQTRYPLVTLTESTSWVRYGVARKRNLWLPALYQRCAFDTILSEQTLFPILTQGLPEKDLSVAVRNTLRGRVLIQTGLSFYPADDSLFVRFFRPAVAVEALMAQRKSMITPHTVGVHIRQTDNTQAILHSPLSAFESAMRADLERDSATTFYVATDNPSLLHVLEARFPIRYSTASPSRSSVEGMQEAVAELWTLMSCPRFHGSYWSSFSDIVVALSPHGDIILKPES